MSSTTAATGKPTPFGSYLLDRKLAVGGMAEVFLARQQGFGGFEKQVVLKRILPSLSTHTDFIQMFLNEARLAAGLSHSNVVQVFEAGEIDGQYYIAMEYIEGTDLKRFYDEAEASGKPTPPGIACRIIADLLAGLHYAHTRTDQHGHALGIVHRDVSPQNVLVTRNGTVKIVDFGIAKATRTAAQNTQVGQVKGKIAYMSPEQAMGKPVDARSDVFACGILLWELCTGSRLFYRPNDMAAILAITEDELSPVRAIRPELPDALERLLARALARPLADRFATAHAMQAELEALIRSQAWAGDRRTLERHMQALLGSSTPHFGAPITGSHAAAEPFNDGPTDVGDDDAALAEPPAHADSAIGVAATLAMSATDAPIAPPVAPPQVHANRQRTPSGMRQMPPSAAPRATPSGSHPPAYSGPLPGSPPIAQPTGRVSTFDGPTAPSARTGRRVLVVITAAVLASVGAIFAIDWTPHTMTVTAAGPNMAVLLVELSEPGTIEVDGKKMRVVSSGEIELQAGRQASLVATTVRGKGTEATRTIALPPARPGERIPLKIAFTKP